MYSAGAKNASSPATAKPNWNTRGRSPNRDANLDEKNPPSFSGRANVTGEVAAGDLNREITFVPRMRCSDLEDNTVNGFECGADGVIATAAPASTRGDSTSGDASMRLISLDCVE